MKATTALSLLLIFGGCATGMSDKEATEIAEYFQAACVKSGFPAGTAENWNCIMRMAEPLRQANQQRAVQIYAAPPAYTPPPRPAYQMPRQTYCQRDGFGGTNCTTF